MSYHDPYDPYAPRHDSRSAWRKITGSAPFAFVVIATITFTLIAAVVAALAYGPIQHSCNRQGEAIGVDVRWGFWEGCLWNDGSGWAPYEQFRTVRD